MDLFLDASDFEMISADFGNDHDRSDLDFDPNFPPMPRERANTWHGPPRTASRDEGVDPAASVVAPSQVPGGSSAPGAARKATARRNAWGNMSYADLIAKAIESSPEKRLTLAEIYAWLVENVPFFKDKGETNSSAGWKNSIRHNLSLHSRFVRVQNEGAGKSSWWMVNPDKAPSKVPRRRAATMDNSKGIGQKRGRQRRSEPTGTVSSTNQSFADVDASPPSYFPLSPEFRGRVSSNASSIGRLSPIPATFEVDLDPVVPTTTQSGPAFHQWNNPAAATDMLSDCLAGILMDDIKPSMAVAPNLNINSGLAADPVFLQVGSNNVNFPQNFLASNHYTPQVTPVDILDTTLQKTETFSMSPLAKVRLGNPGTLPNTSMLCVGGNMSGNCGYGLTGLQVNFQQQLYKTPSVNDLLPNARTQLLHPSPLTFGEAKPSFSTACASNMNNSLLTTIPTSHQEMPQLTGWPGQTVSGWSDTKSLEAEPQTRQRSFTFSSGKLDQNLVKQLLIAKPLLRSDIQKLLQMKRQQLFAGKQTKPSSCVTSQTAPSVQPSEFVEQPHQSMLEQILTGELMEQSDAPQLSETLGQMETKMDVTPVNLVNDAAVFANEPGDLPSDLDLSYLNTESAADIECNIDQVIQHELTFGDELDFAFDPIQPNWNKGKAGANEDSLTNFLSY